MSLLKDFWGKLTARREITPEEREQREKWRVGRFGIVLDNLPEDAYKMSVATGRMRSDVFSMLRPFYESRKGGPFVSFGFLTNDHSKTAPRGIIFGAPRAAADDVAAAYPHHKVIDRKGNVIKPEIPPGKVPNFPKQLQP